MAPQRRKSRSATDEEDPAARQGPAAPAEDQPSAGADDRADADADADDRADADADGHGRIRTAREAANAALRQVLELTANSPESITGVQRTKEGWSICFEVVEDRRIPSTADILATYESVIDRDGELMSFRRIRRYSRGRGDGNGGSGR